jgi:hypothetical protein
MVRTRAGSAIGRAPAAVSAAAGFAHFSRCRFVLRRMAETLDQHAATLAIRDQVGPCLAGRALRAPLVAVLAVEFSPQFFAQTFLIRCAPGMVRSIAAY